MLKSPFHHPSYRNLSFITFWDSPFLSLHNWPYEVWLMNRQHRHLRGRRLSEMQILRPAAAPPPTLPEPKSAWQAVSQRLLFRINYEMHWLISNGNRKWSWSLSSAAKHLPSTRHTAAVSMCAALTWLSTQVGSDIPFPFWRCGNQTSEKFSDQTATFFVLKAAQSNLGHLVPSTRLFLTQIWLPSRS